ncbi:ABC transporter permease [Bacillus sp. 2205SS5-2]|uniref:ABC transporter permease n=1 Tax=Bacillus sp. 2205SS5-2 TaxID=3109031 RepID=UPI003003FEE3
MKWWKGSRALLLPAFIFLLLIAGYGFWQAFYRSIGGQDGITFEYYKYILYSPEWVSSLIYSLSITFISTCLSLIIGLVMTKSFAPYLFQTWGKLLVWLPMLFPHFVGGYLVFFFFSQSGLLSHVAYVVGIIEERSQFPVLVQDQWGIGVILTYVWKEVPFVILMLLPVYSTLNPQFREEVQLLGGGKFHIFRTAEWPWVLPVLLEVGLILFSFILTAFEVPFLLGVTYPKMVSVLAYDWFYSGEWSDRPLAFASLTLLAVCVGAVAFILFTIIQRKRWLVAHGKRRGV